VAAAAKVVREVPDVRFLIIGEGELHEPLARQIKSLGLDRHVLLTGFRADALGLIKSLDLFVMSSVTEGLGSALLEAMACRRPIVGTFAGGIPEIVVHDETGILVPVRDESALAAAIGRVISDPALRERLAVAGRARVETEFSVQRLVERTIEAYRKFGSRSV
jgi:glycosyltransferase involved in cell wall biosynthesis